MTTSDTPQGGPTPEEIEEWKDRYGEGKWQTHKPILLPDTSEDAIPALGRYIVLAEHFLLKQGSGALALHLNDSGWVAALEFGKEAPDSDMVAGAVYGKGATAADALAQALADAGENV